MRQHPFSPPPQNPPSLHQRMGPRPLALHLMMGLCASLSLPCMLPSWRSVSPDSKPANPALPEKLQAILNDLNNPEFDAALTAEAMQRGQNFIAGLKAYRQHPARRDVPDMPVIWRQGTTKLRDYNPSSPHAPVLLIVPSLINRFDILDLDFAPSFLRTLAIAGFRPLVVDWDEPGATEKNFTVDDYVQRLVAITQNIGKPFHLLGYCMGGLLALALAAQQASAIQSLTLMATPWDFHQPDPATGHMLASLAEAWSIADSLPVDMIQYLFTLLQPLQTVTKFIDFAALDMGGVEARQFVLLEDWLNDGVPLTGAVARESLQNWYGKNTPAQFKWQVGGKLIDPRNLSMPSYVVVCGRDRIVPPESSLPLAKLLPHATLHEPMTGHIGLMASRNASHQIWKPYLHWLAEHI